ncbi:MAG: hypothetical protein ACKV2T_02605 [Kofleriaceae bacterium]
MPGIFDYWFDNEWKQRDDINDLAGQAGAAAYGVEMLQHQLGQLRPMLFELSATVAVLVKMLAEAGQVDPKVIQHRVDAELEARRTWRPPPAQPSPPAPLPAIRCTRCGRDVAPARTIMTADGAVCDPACPR